MERIKTYVEELIGFLGLSGTPLTVTRLSLMVFVTVVLAWISYWVCRRLFVPLIIRLTKKTEVKWDEVLFNRKVLISACHIVPAIVVWQLLPLVFYEFPLVRELLTRATAIYITVMSVRTGVVFINSFKYMEEGRRTSAQQYFQSFIGVLKIIIIFVAVIIVVSIIINRNPLAIFAGLGATSAVLMLVFQDTIEGLVAGVRLTSNDMLHKGDWITVPKAGANGIVEEMSLTTVKIRNFDNTIITVSPKTLVDDSFQNWIGMEESDGRRVNRQLYIDFKSVAFIDDTLRQRLVTQGFFKEEEIQGQQVNLTLFCKYMERYLAKRPEVNENMLLMVRQFEATNTGLPIEFYFFLHEKEWKTYEHQLAEILNVIYATMSEFNLKIYQQYLEK